MNIAGICTRCAFAAASLFVAAEAFAAPSEERGKFSRLENKIIAIGWDLIFCEAEDVLANAESFKDAPFDGVGVSITDKSVFSPKLELTKESCAKYVDLLRKCRDYKGLKDSVVELYFQPKRRLAFADDAAWAHAASNLATVAWVAKEAGLPGIFLDTEDYMKSRQFLYTRSDKKAGLTYADAAKIARRRGRELFSAVFREYPDITVLSFYLFLSTPNYHRFGGQMDPAGYAEKKGDLWLAFMNGMLDVAPDTAKIFDGNEDAYWHNAHLKAFKASYVGLHRTLQKVVYPENRDKFRRVIRQSHGLYLDMYTNEKGRGCWYFGPRTPESTRADRFAENVAAAVNDSDGIVWIYGEKHNFIDWKNVHPRRNFKGHTNSTWEVALPGFGNAVRFARDPYTEMMSALKKATPERIKTVETNLYAAVLADGARNPFTVGGLKPGARYAFIGEIHGEKTKVDLVPAKGNYDNWTLGWHTPVLLSEDDKGWVKFATYIRIPPDCNGFKVYQTSAKKLPPARFRNFQVVRLD